MSTSTTTNYTFSRADAVAAAPQVEAAIQALFADRGWNVKLGTTKYGDEMTFSVKVTKVTLNEDGVNTTSAEAKAHDTYANLYGLRGDALGARFQSGSQRWFTYSGIAARNRKMPILALGDDGKTYKFPADYAFDGERLSPIVRAINEAAAKRAGEEG